MGAHALRNHGCFVVNLAVSSSGSFQRLHFLRLECGPLPQGLIRGFGARMHGRFQAVCLSWHVGGRPPAVGLITGGEARAGDSARHFLLAQPGGHCTQPPGREVRRTPVCAPQFKRTVQTPSVPLETLAAVCGPSWHYHGHFRLRGEEWGQGVDVGNWPGNFTGPTKNFFFFKC